MSLHVVPVSRETANTFVDRLHRHNPPVGPSLIYCLAVADETGLIRGVAIVGRPSARPLCDGWTAEVLRTCTDGATNANSMLYGAAWRAAKGLGYRRLVTYTQHDETGASLRAAGWVQAASLAARPGWDAPGRTRDNDLYQSTARWRWEIRANDPPPITAHLPVDEGAVVDGFLDFGADAAAS